MPDTITIPVAHKKKITVIEGAFLDPNGNVEAVKNALYKSAVSLGGDGTLWIKATDSGNTGWE